MFRLLTSAWSWLVDGTTEALDKVLERVRSRSSFRVALDETGAVVTGPDGSRVAHVIAEGDTPRLEPPAAAARLAGASIEIDYPPGWLFRRALDPVAVQGAPFLGAFVRHQIDRLTPWRAEDVHLCVVASPMPGDATRLAVEIGVLPRRLTSAILDALSPCRPARIALVTCSPQDGRRFVMPVDDRSAERLRRLRPTVGLLLVAYLAVWPIAFGWLSWTMAGVADDLAAADRVIDERKAVIAAAARRAQEGTGGGAALTQLRQRRVRAVDVIDALSAALPDSSYATEGSDRRAGGPRLRRLHRSIRAGSGAGRLRPICRRELLRRHDASRRRRPRRSLPHRHAGAAGCGRADPAVTGSIAFSRPLGALIVLLGVAVVGTVALVLTAADLDALTAERDAKSAFVSRSIVAGHKEGAASEPAEQGLAVEAETATAAAARIDSLLRTTIAEAGGIVLSSRAEPKEGEAVGTDQKIAIEAVIQGTTEALQSGVYRLESGHPMFLVDTLDLRPAEEGSGSGVPGSAPMLRATVTLSAYWERPPP